VGDKTVHDVRLNDAIGLMVLRGLHGFGPVAVAKAIDRFDTIGALVEASQAECKGTLNSAQFAKLHERDALLAAHDAARREMDRAAKLGIVILTANDPGYPERLAAIPERPALLYVRGNLAAADRSVACVGTRFPTKFGRVVTERFVSCLADNGWGVVSGLADGIDHIAHEAALLNDLPTVAAIGAGHDMLDDRQTHLAERILEAGGAIVGEQPFGTVPDAGPLIRRNRIQSGLSAGVVVLQAKSSSGTMQTARYALIQGRPLFAPVPPPALAHEEVNQGLTLLTSGTGPELVAAIGATGPFAKMMAEQYADRPVASPIRSREDYPAVMERFEAELGQGLSAAPAP
jgi:DNA processing protein